MAQELPILFNGEMVRAILDGGKMQTRRPIKPQPRFAQWIDGTTTLCWKHCIYNPYKGDAEDQIALKSPFGVPGDRLWVRETTRRRSGGIGPDAWGWAYASYTATLTPVMYGGSNRRMLWWYSKDTCPSIHMPRRASRITLEVERVWCERVKEISKEDAIAEGIEVTEFFDGGAAYVSHPAKDVSYLEHDPTTAFLLLWDSIYAAKGFGWDSNPWVFGCEFKVLEANECLNKSAGE